MTAGVMQGDTAKGATGVIESVCGVIRMTTFVTDYILSKTRTRRRTRGREKMFMSI